MLGRAVDAVREGGQVVVIDLFRGPNRPNQTECLEALRLEIDTNEGRMRTLAEAKTRMEAVGIEEIQFSFLVASRINLGLMVGVKRLNQS